MLRCGYIILVGLAWGQALGAESRPKAFWQIKPKAIERIENGQILVNVKSSDDRLVIEGGGIVKADCNFVFNYASDFDHIEHLGIYVDSAHYDPKLKQVDLKLTALGHSENFKVGVTINPDVDPREIELEIREGILKGLKTTLWFASLGLGRTEVGIHGEYKYDGSGMGKLLHELALETVLRNVAARLRDGAQKAAKK